MADTSTSFAELEEPTPPITVTTFSPAKLSQLPQAERLEWVERIRVFHRQWHTITVKSHT